MVSENGTKAGFGPEKGPETRSVIELPEQLTSKNPVPPIDGSQLFWFVGRFADEIMPWGITHMQRDRQLRYFTIQESIFASALGIICSRNAGFSWTLDGPSRMVGQLQYKLETSNMGAGWHDLITKTTLDLCTQDNGAFIEIVREKDNPSSPFVTLNHLDAGRCWHTGNPKTPVVYQDRLGRYHLLKWYQVIELAELPAAYEQIGLYGLQYCTLTRLLRKLQTTRNMDIFDYEKTSGRNTKTIHMVKGITSQQLTDAMNTARASEDGAGLIRYTNPVLVGTLDPKADVGHDTIDLVGKPIDYSDAEWFKQYINLIAMAFASDYQEFAPLPGGGLGTGAQSEMLHLKSRGKGPATFMKLITFAINFRIMPKTVNFRFDEQDLEAEKSVAEVKAIRAQTRAVRIAAGEITTEAARQIANDEGDLPYEYLELMREEDISPNQTLISGETPESQAPPDVKPGIPGPGQQQVLDLVTPRKRPTGDYPTPNAPVPIPKPGESPAPGQLQPTNQVSPRPPRRVPSIRPPSPLGPKMPPGRKSAAKLLAFLLDPENDIEEE